MAAELAEVMCVGGAEVNKAQLIDALAERLGDKKVAAAAVTGLVDVVVRTVTAGDKVTITGFGVFEKRARAARTARNPRTGEAVTIEQTDVPAFRPGTLFREVVSGSHVSPQAGAGAPAAVVPVSRRPATRVTAAGRLSAVHTATTTAPKADPQVKATKAKVVKGPKAAKAAKEAKTAAKARAKITTKKAAKKSATKK